MIAAKRKPSAMTQSVLLVMPRMLTLESVSCVLMTVILASGTPMPARSSALLDLATLALA